MSHKVSTFSAAILSIILLSGLAARGQTQSAPPEKARLDIVAIGGFLGQLDGFCEQPAATYSSGSTTTPVNPPACAPGGPGGHARPMPDTPFPAALGGVLGAGAWLQTHRERNALVLIQGDNQVPDFAYGTLPATPQKQKQAETDLRAMRQERSQQRSPQYWATLKAQLNPTVVALGPEDFLRSLRTPRADQVAVDPSGTRARHFVQWVRSGAGLSMPFIASNAVVKVEDDGLKASQDGYEIVGGGAASFGWAHTLKVKHPAKAALSFSLEETSGDGRVSGSPRPVPLGPPTQDDDDHTTLTVAEGSLIPGRYYRLRINTGKGTIDLTFRTHEALTTPAIGQNRSTLAQALSGFPVVVTPACTPTERQHPEQVCTEDVVIVSFVDPATSKGLGQDAWTFTSGESGSNRPKYTVGFLTPTEALNAILLRVTAIGDRVPAPLILLMSSLTDADTTSLLEAYPEIRAVVLPPESELLGRGARATAADDSDPVAQRFGARRTAASAPAISYSGDLGLDAIVNGEHPQATRILVRPEWVGETAAAVTTDISRNQHGEWQLSSPSVTVSTIPGVTLDMTVATPGSELTYFPSGFPNLQVGRFKPYFQGSANPAVDAPRLVKIFTTVPGFASAAGEAVRAELRGDVAIVPEDTFDKDAVAWMRGAIVGQNVGWLSRFFLERMIFRSYRFVRADVKGSDLPGVLGKALSDPLGTGTKACVVGLGIYACPGELDKDHPERLRVRDRAIVSTMFYTVVLPDSMAAGLELDHHDGVRDSTDILESLDFYLRGAAWKAFPEDPAVVTEPAQIFQSRNAHEVRRYLNLSTVALGYQRTFADDVINQPALTGSLPVDFKGAKSEQTISGKIDADLALWETRSQAGRLLGSLNVSQRTEYQATKPDGTTPAPSITTPNDSFSIGGRIEKRKITPRWAIEARPYGGVFFEGAFHETKTDLKASRDPGSARSSFGLTEQASFSTPITFKPSTFTYGSGGIDFLPAATDIFPQKKWSASFTKLGGDFAYGQITHVLTGVDLGTTPQDMAQFIGQGPSKLLDAYFATHSDTFDSSVSWQVHDESRWQFRMRVQLEGEVAFKTGSRTFKATISARQDYINITGDVPATSLARNTKFNATLAVPVFWRLELAPTYEFQMATLHDSSLQRLSIQKFELKANLPLFVRFGRGRFLQ